MFYVYEHWRSDTGQCFYVGKGKEWRAYKFACRSTHHRNIVARLRKLKSDVEVRFIAKSLSEAAAHELERERIAHWRALGVPLVNLTDGGEGASGYVALPETRAKLSAASQAYWSNPEARARASERLKADPPARRPSLKQKFIENNPMKSAANREKVSIGRKAAWARPGARDEIRGEANIAHRPNVKEKKSHALKALWQDPDYRASRSGDNNPSRRIDVRAKRSGDNSSSKRPEVRAKMSAARKAYWERKRAEVGMVDGTIPKREAETS